MFKQKKGLSKTISILLFLVVIILVVLITTQVIKKKQTVKIGFIGDFTNDKIKNENVLTSVKIAIEDLNKIYDKKYELVVYDTKGNEPTNIENAFKSANSDNVLAVISTKFDSQAYSLQEKLPTIFVGNVANETAPRNRFFWSIIISTLTSDYLNQHLVLIKLRYKNIKSIGFVVDDERYISDSFLENLEALNEIETSNYLFGLNQLPNIVTDIKKKNPDAIVVLTNVDAAIQFLKFAQENGLGDKLFLGLFTADKKILSEEEKLPKRLIVAPPPIGVLGPNDNTKDDYGIFVNRYYKSTGNRVRNIDLNAYDATTLIGYVISKAKLKNKPESIKEDREEIVKELWAIKNFKSIRGTLTPDAKIGYLRRNYINTFYIEDGRFKPAFGQSI